MCLFSGPVEDVSATKIFARHLEGERQALVYGMQFAISEELAMVLPLPTPADVAEDAVEFVDLSDYEGFFTDLDGAFPAADQFAQGASRGGPVAAHAQPLVVHDVGAFIASFVPTAGDFERLDPRFRLPSRVEATLVRTGATGFAVFQLKPRVHERWFRSTPKRQVSQPMALTFPTTRSDALYFPTLHVHDGAHLPETARFDHTLYLQGDPVLEATTGWGRSEPLAGHLDPTRLRGLVDPGRRAFRTAIHGERPNRDVWISAPEIALDELVRDHPMFRFELALYTATDPFDIGSGGRTWSAASRHGAREWSAAFYEALRELVDSGRHGLIPLREDLDPYWVNGNRLWRGGGLEDLAMGEGRAGVEGSLRIAVWTDRIEPQRVTLAFSELPDHTGCVALREELRALLERYERSMDKL